MNSLFGRTKWQQQKKIQSVLLAVSCLGVLSDGLLQLDWVNNAGDVEGNAGNYNFNMYSKKIAIKY